MGPWRCCAARPPSVRSCHPPKPAAACRVRCSLLPLPAPAQAGTQQRLLLPLLLQAPGLAPGGQPVSPWLHGAAPARPLVPCSQPCSMQTDTTVAQRWPGIPKDTTKHSIHAKLTGGATWLRMPLLLPLHHASHQQPGVPPPPLQQKAVGEGSRRSECLTHHAQQPNLCPQYACLRLLPEPAPAPACPAWQLQQPACARLGAALVSHC